MSQFSTDAFLNLGKALKNYAIANIISIAAGFMIAIIMEVTTIIPLLNESYISEDMIFTMIPIMAVFGFVSLGIGVFVLVRYFQYISALKSAGESADDQNLRRAYRLELWGLILGLVLPVILIIASIVVMLPIFNYIYSGFSPYYPDEEMIAVLILPLIAIFLLTMLGSLIIVILRIVAKFALDNWATEIANIYSGNSYAINLREGTTLMKWGVVVQLCFGSIGLIVFIIGLFRAGKNAILLFSAPPSVTPARTQQQPYSGYGAGPGFQSYYQPNVSGTTIRPPTSAVGSSICPACSTILPDPKALFCPNCGRAL